MEELQNGGLATVEGEQEDKISTKTEAIKKAVDLKVVEKAIKGDEKSFEELYMLTYRFVFSVARHYLENDDDIYDAIQETYLRVYKGIEKLNSPEAFAYWLRKIAENCAKTVKSRKKADQEFEQYENEASKDNENFELSIDITEILGELSQEHRELLVRVYYDKMTVAEIARMQGKPKSTVHSQFKAAKSRLKELLRVRGIDKHLYGGDFITMITTSLRNAIGTSILSATVAQEILDKVKKSGNKKGSAVIFEIARKQRNKAVLRLASLIIAVVIIFVAIFYGIIIFFGGSKGEGGKSSNASRNGSYPSDTLGVSSNDTSHNTSSNNPTNNSTASAGGDFSGNSSNSQSENTSVDTSSDSSSSKDATSSKNETSSTYIPSGPQTVITSRNASYTLSGGKATIVSVDPYLSGNVLVPVTIDGYPIVSIGAEAFSGLQQTSDLIFSEGITSIGDGAFSGSNFGRVILPEGLISIGYKAFAGCSIGELYIPKTVTSIGSPYIWWGMPNIVVDPENPYYYMDGGCLIDRRTMTVIAGDAYRTIPDGVKIIGEGAYYFGLDGTMSISIAIPNSVTEIERNGFAECYGLKILNLPSNLKTIGDFAFFGCEFEENLVIPDTVTYLGKLGLLETVLKNVTFGRGVNKIPERFFSASKGLETVKIPKNITEIESYAFDGCIRLTDVYFEGTEQERNQMIIGEGNEYLLGATWHYESY